MKRILMALAGVMLAGGTAHAQQANVVSSCASITYDANSTMPLTQDTTGKLCSGAAYGRPTYSYNTTGYTAYATPTDMFGICGSASKTIRVTTFWLGINTTAAALQTIHFVKRTTADTGGTETTPAPVKHDSSDAAATGTLHLYTAAPTTGTSAGDARLQTVLSAVLTAAPAAIGLNLPINQSVTGSFITPEESITLRGTGECLYANYAGAALTGGFTSAVGVQWTEY